MGLELHRIGLGKGGRRKSKVNLYKVYNGFLGYSSVYVLVVASSKERALLTAELIFENTNIEHVSESCD